MDQNDLKKVEAREVGRPNAGRTNRLMRELFFSATDPLAPLWAFFAVVAVMLAASAAAFALLAHALAS